MSAYIANVRLADLGVMPRRAHGRRRLRWRGAGRVVRPGRHARHRRRARRLPARALRGARHRAGPGVACGRRRGGAHPAADGEAQAIVITEVLEHVDDPAAVLAELARVTARRRRRLPVRADELHRAAVLAAAPALRGERHPLCGSSPGPSCSGWSRPPASRSRAGKGATSGPAVAWVFHALDEDPLRPRRRGARQPLDRPRVNAVFHALDLVGLGRAVDAIGNRLWAEELVRVLPPT